MRPVTHLGLAATLFTLSTPLSLLPRASHPRQHPGRQRPANRPRAQPRNHSTASRPRRHPQNPATVTDADKRLHIRRDQATEEHKIDKKQPIRG